MWLRDLVRDKQLTVEKISTLVNPADVLTKHLPRARHEVLVDLLGLVTSDADDEQ
jgi:hypothetical protein